MVAFFFSFFISYDQNPNNEGKDTVCGNGSYILVSSPLAAQPVKGDRGVLFHFFFVFQKKQKQWGKKDIKTLLRAEVIKDSYLFFSFYLIVHSRSLNDQAPSRSPTHHIKTFTRQVRENKS